MKLLAAIDLHTAPEAVVREAGTWAARLGGTVDLLYVDDTPDAAVFVGDPNVRAIVVEERDALLAKHAAAVQALLAQLPDAVRGAALCLPGLPADVTVERADAYDAVLVATHGRTGLSHLWLGSVAEQVVRRAHVPVVVLRLPEPG
ncbi:MAG: universal stress protein [Alphaproteobacteria bacterium]|nr:universal stress protein [Alphaproteobacteria bacterium]